MWFRRKPPQDTRQQALQSPKSRFNPFRANVYEAKPQPTAGAQVYAYENLGLVEFAPIGPAVHNRQFIRPLQPGTVFAAFGTYQTGIGGLVTGGIYGQPLLDPNLTIEQQFG